MFLVTLIFDLSMFALPITVKQYRKEVIHACQKPIEFTLISTVKSLLFVGYQFLWFSWVDGTTKFGFQQIRFPLVCILKTSKPRIQESTKLCFFPDPRKIGIHELKYFNSNSETVTDHITSLNHSVVALSR